MELDLGRASKMLSELDLHGIRMDNLDIDVLWFRVMRNTGKWRIKRHTHSSFEFHFIYSGGCTVTLDDDEFEVSAGEFYLTAPGVFHEQKGSGEEEMVEYSLNCDLTLSEDIPTEARYIYDIIKDSPCRPYKDRYGVLDLFTLALQEAYYRNLGFFNHIQCLVTMLLACAARAMKGPDAPAYTIPVKNSRDDHRMDLIEKYIQDNLSGPISTKEIARHLHLSEKQVYRIVSEKKGMSTKDLICSAKLSRSKALLRDTDLSIKQISDRLGFSSEYYFNQFFKREEGYPPGIFRINVQKKK